MSVASVSITVNDSQGFQREHLFTENRTCVIGRASDCDIQLPADMNHREVSRHHCLLDVQLPLVRIRDLASTNGTFVNGERIELRRKLLQDADDTDTGEDQWVVLHDEDVVQIGHIELTVKFGAELEVLQPVYLPPLM